MVVGSCLVAATLEQATEEAGAPLTQEETVVTGPVARTPADSPKAANALRRARR